MIVLWLQVEKSIVGDPANHIIIVFVGLKKQLFLDTSFCSNLLFSDTCCVCETLCELHGASLHTGFFIRNLDQAIVLKVS